LLQIDGAKMKKYFSTKQILMKNFSTQKERILQFIDYKGISKNKFYIKTGISNGILDKNSGLSMETVEKFYKNFPEINPEWLLTGRGEMLREVESKEKVKEEKSGTVKSRLKEFIRYKRLNVLAFEKSINASNGYVNSITKGVGTNYIKKIEEVYNDLNINWLLYGEGDMIGNNNQVNNGIINGVNVQQQNGGSIKVGQNETIQTYKTLLTEKENLIIEYKKQLQEKDKQLSEKDKQISEKDIQISKLLELLSKKNNFVTY